MQFQRLQMTPHYAVSKADKKKNCNRRETDVQYLYKRFMHVVFGLQQIIQVEKIHKTILWPWRSMWLQFQNKRAKHKHQQNKNIRQYDNKSLCLCPRGCNEWFSWKNHTKWSFFVGDWRNYRFRKTKEKKQVQNIIICAAIQ